MWGSGKFLGRSGVAENWSREVVRGEKFTRINRMDRMEKGGEEGSARVDKEPSRRGVK